MSKKSLPLFIMPVMALFFLKTTALIRKQQKYKRHCDSIKEQAANWRFNNKNKKQVVI